MAYYDYEDPDQLRNPWDEFASSWGANGPGLAPNPGAVGDVPGMPGMKYIDPKEVQQGGDRGIGNTGGYSGGKDLNSLISYWKQSHPASNPDMAGLVQFLNQQGVGASHATHAGGLQSDDKIIINGQTYDLGSSFGGGDGRWFDSPMVDGGGGLDPSYTAPFSEIFTPPGRSELPPDFKYPDFKGPGAYKAPTEADMLADPSYKWRFDQGLGAIQNRVAAGGILNSGGSIKDFMKYGQGMASQEYSNINDRKFNEWGADWTHALGEYGTNRGNAADAFATNYQIGKDSYSRAWQEYLNKQNNYYQGQGNAFGRLSSMADLGLRAAG